MSKNEVPQGEDEPFVYSVKTLYEKSGCKHRFKRISPTRLECNRCRTGIIDSPDRPFPLEEINNHYQHLT